MDYKTRNLVYSEGLLDASKYILNKKSCQYFKDCRIICLDNTERGTVSGVERRLAGFK